MITNQVVVDKPAWLALLQYDELRLRPRLFKEATVGLSSLITNQASLPSWLAMLQYDEVLLRPRLLRRPPWALVL